MTKITYNKKVEVTKNQFDLIMNHLDGTCAGKIENGKYFIKLMIPIYRTEIQQIINTVK